jgi:hypothetical protein
MHDDKNMRAFSRIMDGDLHSRYYPAKNATTTEEELDIGLIEYKHGN